ncbi:MAG: TonB family protein [Candidatus Thermochlorobacter aerophilum]|jgi:TonB family protein|uniref:TonB family protein n=1 Tax=Candidatus Thermochlorobacter aerophilus TaxID=1868324 RepID=A0A395LZU5_9BACT|nr:MAG: TonB family protein [Candidatus Thermochlorobacter aerophilum]
MKSMVRLTVCLFCWLLTVSAFAQQSKLIGRVTDDEGNPLPAVLVAVSGATATEAAFSNAQGYYVFLNIPPGEYSIKASKKGLPNWKGQVSVSAGTTNRLDIRIGSDEKLVAAAQPKKEAPKPTEPKLADAKPAEQRRTETRTTTEKPSEPKPTQPTAPAKTEDERAAEQAIESASQLLSDADVAALESMSPAEVVGGIAAVYKNLKYPDFARKQKLQGQVVAKVYIDKDGHVAKIQLLKTANEVFNEEVFRTLTEEVSYKPATMNGKPVPSALIIPVKFELK